MSVQRAACQGTYFGANGLIKRPAVDGGGGGGGGGGSDSSVSSSVTATTAGKVSCFCVSREAFAAVFGEEQDLQAVMKRGLADRCVASFPTAQ